MPNWCSVTYEVIGKKEDLKKLNDAVIEILGGPSRVANGFGNAWMGNLVDYFGGDWKEIRCRGEIIDHEYKEDENTLTLVLDTAWSEPPEFRHFLEKVLPSIHIYYIEEEPGCDIYCTNDDTGLYFPYRYRLELTTNITCLEYIFEEYKTFDELKESVNDICEDNDSDKDEDINTLQEKLETYIYGQLEKEKKSVEDIIIKLIEFELCYD